MIQTIALISLSLFAAGLVFNLPNLWSQVRLVRGKARAVSIAWALMFIALGVFFGREESVLGIGSMDRSAWFQIACVIPSALILTVLTLNSAVMRNLGRWPIALLAIYGLLGVLSSIYSPAPEISAYKGGLILIDVLLVSAVIAVFARSGDAKVMLNLSYFLAAVFVAGSLMGAVFEPLAAFEPSGGVVGVILGGTYPYMNPNSLGFVAAVISVVAFSRVTQRAPLATRFFWTSQLVMGLTVLFLAQARTSVISFFIAISVMTLGVPGKRWVASLLGFVVFVVVSYSSVTGNLPTWGEHTIQYAERGQGDGGLQSLKGRVNTWLGPGLDMIRDEPILGHGFDAGVRYGARKYGLENTHMHNSHFQILANSGVLGYVVWLFMMVSVCWPMAKKLKRKHWPATTQEDLFFIEMVAIFIVVLVRTLTGVVLVSHLWSLMLFLGMVAYLSVENASIQAPKRNSAVRELQKRSIQKRENKV